MPDTAHALPWPDGTEPVRDAWQWIKWLAEAADPAIWPGFKVLAFKGVYTTDVDGVFMVYAPGPGAILGVTASYLGLSGPIHTEFSFITGAAAAGVAWRPDNTKCANTSIGVVGTMVYAFA